MTKSILELYFLFLLVLSISVPSVSNLLKFDFDEIPLMAEVEEESLQEALTGSAEDIVIMQYVSRIPHHYLTEKTVL